MAGGDAAFYSCTVADEAPSLFKRHLYLFYFSSRDLRGDLQGRLSCPFTLLSGMKRNVEMKIGCGLAMFIEKLTWMMDHFRAYINIRYWSDISWKYYIGSYWSSSEILDLDTPIKTCLFFFIQLGDCSSHSNAGGTHLSNLIESTK